MLAMNCGDPRCKRQSKPNKERMDRKKGTHVVGLLLGQNRVVRETLLAADAQGLRQAGLNEALLLLLEVAELHVVYLVLVLVIDVVLGRLALLAALPAPPALLLATLRPLALGGRVAVASATGLAVALVGARFRTR